MRSLEMESEASPAGVRPRRGAATSEGATREGLELPRPELDDHALGSYDTGRPGPLFVVVGGIHGNEPAGVHAISTVVRRLSAEGFPLRGRFVGLAGNLTALRVGERFVERDLNRMWSASEIAALRRADAEAQEAEGPDEAARRRLLGLIEAAIEGHRAGPVVLLDLHSTSAGGAPFSVIGDTLRNRRIAFAFPAPVILGLEEAVDGALLEFFGERGHVAVGFEGGEHTDPRTVLHHEAAIWLALMEGGALEEAEHAALAAEMRARLAEASRGLPAVVEVRYRHAIAPVDGFRMRGGFANFDPVRAGDVLAADKDGEVRAIEGGRILLPLYQGLGQDGFFLSRDVHPFWLRLSRWLRRLHLQHAIRVLPGVRKHPSIPDAFLVDTHIARLWPVELFHLLGYRKRRPEGERLVFSRRVERPWGELA